MTTQVEVIELKVSNTFVDRLKIRGAENQKDALHYAEKWCEENDSYNESIAWEEEDQISKDEFETVYYVRVCPNDYE